MNLKRIRFAAVLAVVALTAFGCSAAEQAPVAEAPAVTATVPAPASTDAEVPAEGLAVVATEEASDPTAGSEVDSAEPVKPEMVRKPIAWAVFKFDPGVPAEDREFVRRVVKTVQQYFVIPRPKGPPAKVKVVGYWNSCMFDFDAAATVSHIGVEICVSGPGWRDTVTNWSLIAHEWFHVVQGNLAIPSTGLSTSLTGLSTVPAWFMEGSAEWMAWNAVAHFDVVSQAHADSTTRWWASRVSVPLNRMVTLQGLLDASPGSADSFGVAYWAVDYLGATPQKLLLFYRRLGEGMDFQKAAKRTFGRAINAKFYKDFEEFRGRGFYG